MDTGGLCHLFKKSRGLYLRMSLLLYPFDLPSLGRPGRRFRGNFSHCESKIVVFPRSIHFLINSKNCRMIKKAQGVHRIDRMRVGASQRGDTHASETREPEREEVV